MLKCIFYDVPYQVIVDTVTLSFWSRHLCLISKPLGAPINKPQVCIVTCSAINVGHCNRLLVLFSQ